MMPKPKYQDPSEMEISNFVQNLHGESKSMKNIGKKLCDFSPSIFS